MYAYEMQCSGSLGVSAMVHNGNTFQHVVSEQGTRVSRIGHAWFLR